MLPTIQVTVDSSEHNRIKSELINQIDKYYPISCNYPSDSLEEFKLIDAVILNKISNIQADNLPEACKKLLAHLIGEFGEEKIFNRYYEQLPNYKLSVTLLDNTVQNIRAITWLTVEASLLSNCFTVYFENSYWFNDISRSKNLDSPVAFRVISGNHKGVDADGKYIKLVKDSFQRYFPDYQFCEPYFLMKTEVEKGIPFRMNYRVKSNTNSLYNYLFCSVDWSPNTEITM